MFEISFWILVKLTLIAAFSLIVVVVGEALHKRLVMGIFVGVATAAGLWALGVLP